MNARCSVLFVMVFTYPHILSLSVILFSFLSNIYRSIFWFSESFELCLNCWLKQWTFSLKIYVFSCERVYLCVHICLRLCACKCVCACVCARMPEALSDSHPNLPVNFSLPWFLPCIFNIFFLVYRVIRFLFSMWKLLVFEVLGGLLLLFFLQTLLFCLCFVIIDLCS